MTTRSAKDLYHEGPRDLNTLLSLKETVNWYELGREIAVALGHARIKAIPVSNQSSEFSYVTEWNDGAIFRSPLLDLSSAFKVLELEVDGETYDITKMDRYYVRYEYGMINFLTTADRNLPWAMVHLTCLIHLYNKELKETENTK